jgi:hypothetical protein
LGRSHRLSQELERRVETAGYLFTQATLKTNLMDLSPLTAGLLGPQTIWLFAEKEIETFIGDLRYPGGTVSSTDVISWVWSLLCDFHSSQTLEGAMGRTEARSPTTGTACRRNPTKEYWGF